MVCLRLNGELLKMIRKLLKLIGFMALVSFGLLWVISGTWQTALLLFLAGLALAMLLFGLWAASLPWSIRPFFRILLWPRYSLRSIGMENIPKTGPVMLTSNHVTWIDGFAVAAISPRPITVLVNKEYCDNPGQRWLARRMNIIPIPASGPKAQKMALDLMKKALDEGRTVGLFPEAQLCRSGAMNPFQRGLELILRDKPDVKIIPIGLAGFWGSIFSFSEGRFFKKWPKGLRRKLGVSFGPPLPSQTRAIDLRQHVLEQVTRATELISNGPMMTEILNLELGHWRHPELGLLTASAPDFIQPDRKIHQVGNKPGSVGQALPGVAIKAVGPDGQDLPMNQNGRLFARVAGKPGWLDTGVSGRVEPDGFVWLDQPELGHLTTTRMETIRENGVSRHETLECAAAAGE
jgi:1-acyl-sn-glycerol-3-phosphate acyltransferase